MNELATIQPAELPAITDDGWADAAAEAASRMIRGNLLLFADWHWTIGKEKTEFQRKRLLALATAAAIVRWWDGKPTLLLLRQPGKPLPPRDQLGELDRSKWQKGPDGQPRDPLQSTRYLYLTDPQTEEAFTYITTSGGGHGAISALGDQVQNRRYFHPHAVPIVELGAEPMQTRYGRKSKPVLQVVGWMHDEPIEPEKRAAARKADMDDDCPF